jgi:hypothetical protein
MRGDVQLPMTLQPNRVILGVICAGSAFGAAVGIFMIRDSVVGRGTFVFLVFGLFTILGGMGLLPNRTRLELTTEGFTFVSLLRSRSVRWADVSEFSVMRIGGARIVTWHAGSFPDMKGYSPPELAELLNALRARYGGA